MNVSTVLGRVLNRSVVVVLVSFIVILLYCR